MRIPITGLVAVKASMVVNRPTLHVPVVRNEEDNSFYSLRINRSCRLIFQYHVQCLIFRSHLWHGRYFMNHVSRHYYKITLFLMPYFTTHGNRSLLEGKNWNKINKEKPATSHIKFFIRKINSTIKINMKWIFSVVTN